MLDLTIAYYSAIVLVVCIYITEFYGQQFTASLLLTVSSVAAVALLVISLLLV